MATPVKTSDGVFFLALREPRVQLNGVDFTSDGIITNLKEGDAKKIDQVDASIINQAKENCEAWFGKKLSDEFLENVYDSALRIDELRAQFAKSADGSLLTKIFNEKRASSRLEDVSGPYDVIVELFGIQFIRRGYNPVWRILQVRERVKPKPEIPDEYMFQDE